MKKIGLLVAVVACVAITANAADEKKTLVKEKVTGMKKLEIKLPAPLFEGTPKAIKGFTNLAPPKPKGWKRPAYFVPEGTVNVAKGKKVTHSGMEPIIGEPKQITDGSKDGNDSSYVELDPGKQYVQIDLGEKCDIYAIMIWHFHKEARVYKDVIIQVADDEDMIQNKQVIFNNDDNNSSKMGVGNKSDLSYIETFRGKLIDANKNAKKQVQGRYIRFYSNGNSATDMNHYIEIEVFGKKSK